MRSCFTRFSGTNPVRSGILSLDYRTMNAVDFAHTDKLPGIFQKAEMAPKGDRFSPTPRAAS